jgi:hypothetical protein
MAESGKVKIAWKAFPDDGERDQLSVGKERKDLSAILQRRPEPDASAKAGAG